MTLCGEMCCRGEKISSCVRFYTVANPMGGGKEESRFREGTLALAQREGLPASVTPPPQLRMTALHLAVEEDLPAMVEQLLAAGADPEKADVRGRGG